MPTAAVTVVVPTYNRADLLPETLEAVFAQSLPPAEVIVVDDGSTDDTPALLARHAGRLRAIRLPNGGDLVARNAGLRAARTPLVAFCDSDDLWRPGFLAAMAAQWEREPALLACYADFLTLRDGVLSGRSKFDDAPPGFWDGLRPAGGDGGVFDAPVAARLVAFQPFLPSAMAVAREPFLALGGWDEGVSRIVGCDFATALRVAMHPPLGVVRAPLLVVRKHPGNFSADTERMNLGDALVLEHVLRGHPGMDAFGPEIRRSIDRRRREALDAAFSRRDFRAVRDIRAMLPPDPPLSRRAVKVAIARLPGALAAPIAALLERRPPPGTA